MKIAPQENNKRLKRRVCSRDSEPPFCLHHCENGFLFYFGWCVSMCTQRANMATFFLNQNQKGTNPTLETSKPSRGRDSQKWLPAATREREADSSWKLRAVSQLVLCLGSCPFKSDFLVRLRDFRLQLPGDGIR